MTNNTQDLARIFRRESGRVTAALIAQFRDFDLAEEALADATIEAARVWTIKGAPDNGAAWLFSVARRRAIDRIRKQKSQSLVLQEVVPAYSTEEEDMPEDAFTIPDERLRLIFTCCHPALSREAQVALTLRSLCGLTAREIARAFLTSETTMNQRLTRAKAKIRKAGIAYKVPETEDLSERLQSVLAVIYLIYNESYSAYSGQSLTREDLANEAIRLADITNRLLPEPEVTGLLCLIKLHHARRRARTDAIGDLVPLEHQNRQIWDHVEIATVTKVLFQTMALSRPGPYQIQAAIGALHAQADSWSATDWNQISELYAVLNRMTPSPVIALNHAVSIGQTGDLDRAFAMIETLHNDLQSYQPYHAARADILAKLGRQSEAHAAYDQAIALSHNAAEQKFLSKQKRKIIVN